VAFLWSIAEAKYSSRAITIAKFCWLRILFRETHIPLPVVPIIWCNNVSAISLASNLVFLNIFIDYNFVREKVGNRDISFKFMSTNDRDS